MRTHHKPQKPFYLSKMEELDQAEIQKVFFFPVCNKAEIERIFHVANGRDYLLKLRAETIVDHMRLFRVYRNKALAQEGNWSLEQSFDSTHYETYLATLSEANRRKCQAITYGNMFSNDPNGTIFQSPYGPLITISESLSFFLKFAHLALMEFDCEVPMHVRMNGLRIAVRVMLKTEAMDFLMDPRGILPKSVANTIHAPIHQQMEFIAGHEFAHYILGHISADAITNKPIFHAITPHDKDYKPLTVFSHSQRQELDADLKALEFVEKDEAHRIALLDAALLWFACLDLYEAVSDALCLRNPCIPSSHPSAKNRFEHLLANVLKPANYNVGQWSRIIETVETFKPLLLHDISTNIEMYEFYGSVYLDKPNTAWRGKELIDRKDYY